MPTLWVQKYSFFVSTFVSTKDNLKNVIHIVNGSYFFGRVPRCARVGVLRAALSLRCCACAPHC
ncbi:MAG: hypothetical protein NZ455_00515 [Bacteroidia bacterium]|nr:hypothetical protein [Bacteroidia bacterium]MDW8346725.1 hypothetical protein [Bacteroidia bacterium]MDW8347295.1 hypothetical protein [Bacteroidia bacterium]